jgi:hypothetical protein
MLFNVRSSNILLGHFRSCNYKLVQVSLGYVLLGQVVTGYVM